MLTCRTLVPHPSAFRRAVRGEDVMLTSSFLDDTICLPQHRFTARDPPILKLWLCKVYADYLYRKLTVQDKLGHTIPQFRLKQRYLMI